MRTPWAAVRGRVLWAVEAQPWIVRLARYAGVSVIASAVGFTVLGVLVGIFHAPAGWSNVTATLAAAVPSFELNRRWAWQRRGGRATARQVIPFFAMTLSGLALSTYIVQTVSIVALAYNVSNGILTLAVEIANLSAWGLLWVVQFLILDRLLFRRRRAQTEALTTA